MFTQENPLDYSPRQKTEEIQNPGASIPQDSMNQSAGEENKKQNKNTQNQKNKKTKNIKNQNKKLENTKNTQKYSLSSYGMHFALCVFLCTAVNAHKAGDELTITCKIKGADGNDYDREYQVTLKKCSEEEAKKFNPIFGKSLAPNIHPDVITYYLGDNLDNFTIKGVYNKPAQDPYQSMTLKHWKKFGGKAVPKWLEFDADLNGALGKVDKKEPQLDFEKIKAYLKKITAGKCKKNPAEHSKKKDCATAKCDGWTEDKNYKGVNSKVLAVWKANKKLAAVGIAAELLLPTPVSQDKIAYHNVEGMDKAIKAFNCEEYMKLRSKFLRDERKERTDTYEKDVKAKTKEITDKANVTLKKKEQEVVDPKAIDRVWKTTGEKQKKDPKMDYDDKNRDAFTLKDAEKDVKERRKNPDSIIHMQYNILALNLTETGGFGNTLPATSLSASDKYAENWEEASNQWKTDKKNKAWAKKFSPSLLWLATNAKTHADAELELQSGFWKGINRDILYNHKLNLDKLMCEVLETEADIITFQEVDTFKAGGDFNLEKRMAALGYRGLHTEKVKSSGLFGFVDGPAIFWDNKKFKLLGKPTEFAFESTIKGTDKKEKKAQCAIYLTLQNVFTGKTFTVLSAHMASGGGDAEHTEQLLAKIKTIEGDLICGIDFNATAKEPNKTKTNPPTTFPREIEKVLATDLKTAHREITNEDFLSTWQRRCCGEQGDKIKGKRKDGDKKTYLVAHAKAIDHSFYRGQFTPKAAKTMKDAGEISRRYQDGGLPAAGNSSDHLYVCVEYTQGGEPWKSYWDKPFFGKSWATAKNGYLATGAALLTGGAVFGGLKYKAHKDAEAAKWSPMTKVLAALGVLTVVPAIAYGVKKYFFDNKDSAETDTESSTESGDETTDVKSGKKSSSKKKSGSKKDGKSKMGMYIFAAIVLLALAGGAAYFFLSGSDEAEYEEGELPVGDDRV